MFTNNTKLVPYSNEKCLQYTFIETNHIIDYICVKSCYEHTFNISFINFEKDFILSCKKYLKTLKHLKILQYNSVQFVCKNIKTETLSLTDKIVSINLRYKCSKNRFNKIHEKFMYNNEIATLDYDTLYIYFKPFS